MTRFVIFTSETPSGITASRFLWILGEPDVVAKALEICFEAETADQLL